MSEELLVTGGLGFIGSAYVRAQAARGRRVLNVDLDTYAGDERRVAEAGDAVRTERLDVASGDFARLVAAERPRVVVHFAAETHVTRSETDPERFFHANVEGTRRVLESAAEAGVALVVHVSTDEVYGACEGEPFREDDKEPGEGRATSAYARSKAVADHLARDFARRVPTIVVRPTNCFGPWQHPEKAIPRWITRALRGEPLPVWGDGRQVRDWMYVDDACAGIDALLERGEPGHVYNLGPEGEGRANVEIARLVARAAGGSDDDVYLTAYDRPQHDRRYAVDTARIRALGWRPSAPLEQRIADTVDWYRAHEDWWRSHVDAAERLYADAGARGPAGG
jgi:dTDP-glucose 4,6-dehydratase